MAQFGKVVHLEAVTRYQVGFQDSLKDLRVGGVSFFKKNGHYCNLERVQWGDWIACVFSHLKK